MRDVILGTIAVVAALGVLLAVILWSRSIVERIHRRKLKTLREIRREFFRGR